MAVQDEVIRLMVQANPEVVDDMTRKFAANEQELRNLQNAFKSGTMSAEEFETAATKIVTSQEQLSTKLRTAQGGMKDFTQELRSGSYALQDFLGTSGDIGAKLNSITNNLPQLLSGLGNLGLVLSTLVTVGVAVYRNWDSIATLWTEKLEIPKHANDLSGLKDQLEKVNKALEEQEKKGSLTREELNKYNASLKERLDLEQKIGAEQTAQDARKQHTKEERSLGSEVSEQTGGANYDKFTAVIAEQLKSPEKRNYDMLNQQYEKLYNKPNKNETEVQYLAQIAKDMNELAAKIPFAEMLQKPEERTRKAQELLNKAREGDIGAYRQVRGLIGGQLGEGVAANFARIDPDEVKAVKAGEEEGKALRRAAEMRQEMSDKDAARVKADIQRQVAPLQEAQRKREAEAKTAANKAKHDAEQMAKRAKANRDARSKQARPLAQKYAPAADVLYGEAGNVGEIDAKQGARMQRQADKTIRDQLLKEASKATGGDKFATVLLADEALKQIKKEYSEGVGKRTREYQKQGLDPQTSRMNARNDMLPLLQEQIRQQAETEAMLKGLVDQQARNRAQLNETKSQLSRSQ